MSPRQPKTTAGKKAPARRRAASVAARAPAAAPDFSATPVEQIHLARHVLQPVRDAFGSFTPNSVYRSQSLERALKNKPATWLSTSQHATGEACDIEIVGMATLELAAWARDHLADFDQIICECYDPRQGPNSGWVHVSLKAPGSGANRRQCLSYVADPASGRLVYVHGLTATT